MPNVTIPFTHASLHADVGQQIKAPGDDRVADISLVEVIEAGRAPAVCPDADRALVLGIQGMRHLVRMHSVQAATAIRTRRHQAWAARGFR